VHGASLLKEEEKAKSVPKTQMLDIERFTIRFGDFDKKPYLCTRI
jgi:hypothetical protein